MGLVPGGPKVFAVLAADPGADQQAAPHGGGLPADQATTLVRSLQAIPGVRAVADLRRPAPQALPARTGLSHALPTLAILRCTRLLATTSLRCREPVGTTTVFLDPIRSAQVTPTGLPLNPTVPAQAVDTLPLLGLIAVTDGTSHATERVRTALEAASPGSTAVTAADVNALKRVFLTRLEHLATAALLLTLLVAGCSLTIATIAGLIERRRPLALLRLAGAGISDLYLLVLAETAIPLISATTLSSALGAAVALGVLHASGAGTWHGLPPTYWWALGTGIPLALLTLTSTLPLLNHLTTAENTRSE